MSSSNLSLWNSYNNRFNENEDENNYTLGTKIFVILE